jgi:effector-binding domain-containing protein
MKMANEDNFAEKIYKQMRVHTMSAIDYFHVTDDPVAFDKLDMILDSLLERLYEAKRSAGLGETGPDITRYYQVESGLYAMEVGIPVKAGAKEAGQAKIKKLPPFRCAGVLLWGSLAHITEAYTALTQKMAEQGLEPSNESREWVYYFEAPNSEQNLMGIFHGIKGGKDE